MSVRSTEEIPGTLVQRCVLPPSTGMEAMEARLLLVQEVPPRAELRFYAIRGATWEELSTRVAHEVLREHAPRRPVTELSEIELWAEISVLRSETDRMRRVYAAVLDWRRQVTLVPAEPRTKAMLDVVDAAIAEEGP